MLKRPCIFNTVSLTLPYETCGKKKVTTAPWKAVTMKYRAFLEGAEVYRGWELIEAQNFTYVKALPGIITFRDYLI